jgi:flagellar motor switch protein FliG
MQEAVGPLKADSLMEAIQPEAAPGGAIDLLLWLTPATLVPLIQDEHPQVIAVLLVQLEPEIAAQVLHALPASVQTGVVHRIATLGPVSADALAMLGEVLDRRIAESHGPALLAIGGPREAADIINQAGKAAERRIMPELARLDRTLARAVEHEMFKFEHLYALDSQSMGTLLREVESEVLIDALKGIEDAQREVFFRAMSSRAADGLRDEIAARGRLKLVEVAEAQRQIVTAARRLAADGAIAFGAGGGDDEYV